MIRLENLSNISKKNKVFFLTFFNFCPLGISLNKIFYAFIKINGDDYCFISKNFYNLNMDPKLYIMIDGNTVIINCNQYFFS